MACSSVLSCKTSPFSIHQSKAAAAAAKSLQLYPTLWDPIDGSPPGSPVPGILQARTLEWVAISFSNAWKWKVKVKSLKSCPTLRNLMDCSLPGSSAHGIFQARVLEWFAIAFSNPKLLYPKLWPVPANSESSKTWLNITQLRPSDSVNIFLLYPTLRY